MRAHRAAFGVALLLLVGCDGSPGAETSDVGPQPADAGVDLALDVLPPRSSEHQAQVDELVAPIMEGQWTAGLVVGLVTSGGTEVYAYGQTTDGGPAPDENTLFEIGSITKTFTSLLLADFIEDGAVALNQPVQELLPADQVTVPTRSGVSITLKHLSTHTSGLPRMPDNFNPADWSDPYVDYGVSQLYEFLNNYTLTVTPGTHFEYSNVGGGLLGHALTLAAGQPYADLVSARITSRLGMPDTVIALSSDQEARFAQGHDADLAPVPPWNIDVLAPAGALRSTARDMLVYLAAQAGLTDSALASAMALTHVPQATIDARTRIGLAWLETDGRYLWHTGGTGGFGTFVGFDRGAPRGTVVLSNTQSIAFQPELALGLALLRMLAAQPYDPTALPATLALDPEVLDQYTGTYQNGFNVLTRVSVTRVDAGLYLTPFGQAPSRLYPTAEAAFYLRSAPVRVTFSLGASGGYDSMLVQQDGAADYTATRVP
jgi:serine-type D-Ala-D-Ala carboxypeptidase/endopeptidase